MMARAEQVHLLDRKVMAAWMRQKWDSVGRPEQERDPAIAKHRGKDEKRLVYQIRNASRLVHGSVGGNKERKQGRKSSGADCAGLGEPRDHARDETCPNRAKMPKTIPSRECYRLGTRYLERNTAIRGVVLDLRDHPNR